MHITNDIRYIGVNDHEIDLFEGQYIVPNGMAYNSYVILDEKVAVMDTVDVRFAQQWLQNLQDTLAGRQPDYLIIQHMEPDHSSSIMLFMEKYPQAVIVSNDKSFPMMQQFFGEDFAEKKIAVKSGDTLSLGAHQLTFVAAPMVHWPEVIVTYDATDKVLFSADGFGKFGALDVEEDWACEARRYYIGIVGKYGMQVQKLLKVAATLDIQTICPLHGPVLTENLGYYINLYDIWSSYRVEAEGVFVAFASIHGNTAEAAEKMKEILLAKGCPKVAMADLSRDDVAECVEDAFKYGKTILMAASYDGGVFAPMETFLHHLKSKAFQNRKVALVENGSWAPCANRAMSAVLETMKNITICENKVTIKSVMKENDIAALEALADEILAD